MSISIEKIRETADRVAASHGLSVVELEFLGGGKHRTLRIYIEQNPEQRARRAAEAATDNALMESLGNRSVSPDHLAWVTHEDCEQFSRDFGTVLDVEDLVPGNIEYTLEVSSPGWDRKLTTRADYERFQASAVRIKTFTPVDGNRNWMGKLTEVKAEGIVLDLTAKKQKASKKGGIQEQTIEIPFANIEKANLAPEL